MHDDTEDEIHTSHPHSPLRSLGSFEHIIDLYISRNPVQFSLAIELASPISPGQLARALALLQGTHPLLSVGIERSGDRGRFCRSDNPIPLHVVHGSDWVAEAAAEQTRPIDSASSPLAQATLMTDASGALGAVVLLTFSHQITDGRGALRAAHDLLTLIGGRLPPARRLPVAQETLLERMPSTVEPEGSLTAVASSPRGAATLRPFDASPPNVEVAQLDHATTERLRANARAHAATVQGALCAAAAQALSKLTGAESIRINAPIDLRSALSLEDDVVNRFTSTTVVLQSPADDSLWTLAQDATAQLRVARAAARETALMLASLDPVGAVEAEAAMLTATDADLEITNLGISNAGTPSAVAIWGPIMTTQVRDERILGAITHGGRLRLVLTTHRDSEALAATIADLLA